MQTKHKKDTFACKATLKSFKINTGERLRKGVFSYTFENRK